MAVGFQGALFSSGELNFDHAAIGGLLRFDRAEFTGGKVDFSYSTFSDGFVGFSRAKFSGSDVDFSGADFFGSGVDFMGDLSPATFTGGVVDFSAARDWSHPPDFPWTIASALWGPAQPPYVRLPPSEGRRTSPGRSAARQGLCASPGVRAPPRPSRGGNGPGG